MMRFLWAKLAIALVVAGSVVTAHAAEPVVAFQEKPWNQLSDREVSDWGQSGLAVDAKSATKWKHGETTHFIIHYFHDSDKIARRSELFYAEIRDFFGNRPDLLGRRKSHIFAFRDKADWSKFISGADLGPWLANAVGITRGNEFFYLPVGENGQFDFKGKVQAHEMTHLVFNRFFTSRPPLWLNEGIAEYFGQRKTTTLMDFRDQMRGTPKFSLDRLFSSRSYPHSPLEVQAFYAEAAIVVDFLTMTDERRVLLPKFVDAMTNENDVAKALTIYGYRSLADFEADYSRYRRRF
jgi:hypothetical protein